MAAPRVDPEEGVARVVRGAGRRRPGDPGRAGRGRALRRTEDVDALVDATPTDTLRLLPAFDPWVLGPGTADPHILDPARRAAVSRAAGWIAPVVTSGGLVVGTWDVTSPNNG